ncbi:calcium ion binding protein, putative [Ricinus communis]|uniref:Calcium ion binding protein, putative n=2 Tax=Ricinus communis TaxID=3988 RepID=B9SGM3_RICCO|nr:calcium ion binding protein, putative [Ricinus communis]
MVSDGKYSSAQGQQPFIRLYDLFSSDGSCDETYGFFPCTTTILGNIFLILVYGYLMFLSAKLLSDGSEILLQILGPGIIGGLFLPVLSALPDSAIILASGLSGSTETAQSQVSVGMGLMAGSTVLLLTLLWGSCLIVGKCDIEGSVAVDSKDTKTFSLIGSGVTTDIWTSFAARLMVISIIPFILVQLPQVLHRTSQSRLAILVSLIVSLILLVCYSLYQVVQPWIQKRRIAYAKHKNIISGILKDLKKRSLGRLFTVNGDLNRDIIQKLFKTIDDNSDGYLTIAELKALIIGIQFDELDIDVSVAVDQVLKDFDTSGDSCVDMDEFTRGISKWLREAKHSARYFDDHSRGSSQVLTGFDQQTSAEEDVLGDQTGEISSNPGNPKWNTTKAVLMLILGTIVAAVFADPLVDAVDNFSTASNIPTFFVSFVILPFASSSEVVSDMIFASRKKSRYASLAYSEIYGSVTMSNVLSLSVFLGLVYFRGLTWNFSSEVLIILIVCIAIGLIASLRTTFPLWMSLVAYAMYPFSLLLAYIFNYVLGWS